MVLGGTSIQMPIIRKAKEMGMYVITCDNRPDNPGHAIADEYHNVSIMDADAVLDMARTLNVDAVVNYILEAGIQTAAYVQEVLGKPTSPYNSVHVLSNKKLFRLFLKNNGFNVPEVYENREDIIYPVVVKPTDLWGSRGVSKVERKEDLDAAVRYALDNSLHGEIIIEQFIEPWHAPVEGDGFAVNGVLTTHLWGDCYPDPKAPNPITPVLYCFPSEKPRGMLSKLDSELQRLMTLLKMKTNAYNVEARFDTEGKVYLMEVAPRNGSNATTEVTSMATGKNIMEGTLLSVLGEDCSKFTDEPCGGYWCSCIVHTNKEGVYDGVWFAEDFAERFVVSFEPFVEKGDIVYPYTGTNRTIGMLVARFPSRKQQHAFMDNPGCSFKVMLK